MYANTPKIGIIEMNEDKYIAFVLIPSEMLQVPSS